MIRENSELWDGIERRQAPRFSVDLAVRLDDAQGCTRDASVTGVFFTTQHALTVGAPITFALDLEHADARGIVRVVCKGTVVRIESGQDAFGVAVHITDHGVEGQDGIVAAVSQTSGV